MAKWLNDLFKTYMEEQLEEDLSQNNKQSETPIIGGIYFGSLKALYEDKPNKPLYYLIIDKVDDNLYEVLKISDHHEFATNVDVILDIGTMKVIVQTDTNFYLTNEEINKFILIYKISEQELHKMLTFRDGEPTSLKTGVTPIFNEDIRKKFKQEEFNQIKDYHMRIFALLSEDELEEEPKVKVYILKSLSQVCSVISARVQITYHSDDINSLFKNCEIVNAQDLEFISLEDGTVAIYQDPVINGFYLIEPPWFWVVIIL